MKKEDLFSLLGIEDIHELPEAIMTVIESNTSDRDRVYQELLRLNNYDMSYDWFQEIYENELSERKNKKQDFTPRELGIICSKITIQKGTMHEPTAGNGSMIITDWWERCKKVIPWEHFPSQNMVTCWELSSRAIPILLLNLSIRGIMGYVYHGDVLENKVKQKYILLNKTDDALAFSEVIKAGVNDKIVKE